MKKIIGLTIAVLLSVSMLSTGAWAFWADTESSANNQLTAGTLDMVPTTSGTGPAGKYTVTAGGNEVNGNVVFDRLLPGESGSITWTLVNNGSLPGTLVIASTGAFDENGSNEPESAVAGNNGGGNGDVDAYVGVKLQRGVGTNQTNAEANFTYILADGSNYVPFSGLEGILDAESEAMASNGGNDTIVYKLSWSIASDIRGAVGGKFVTGEGVDVNENIIQSDTAEVDITFTLNQ